MSKSSGLIQPTIPPKDPTLTLLLNLFTAGGGYLYIGQTNKGIVMIVVTLVLLCFGIGILIPIFTCIDGYLLAKELKDGEPINEWQFCWNQSPRIEQLLSALQTAPDEQVPAIQASLIAEGPSIYSQLAEESSNPISSIGLTRIVQTLESYEAQASTEDLIGLFTVVVIDNESRPIRSTRAEAALLARGPAIIPQLLPLLNSVLEGERFYAIKLLNEFTASQIVEPLLKVIKEDSNPNCRMAALISLMKYNTAEVGDSLVEAMKAEAKRTHEEVIYEQVSNWTDLGLGIFSGKVGFGGLITRSIVNVLEQDLTKVTAQNRLLIFGEAYGALLVTSESPPIDTWLSATNDPDKHIRAFIILCAAALMVNLQDEEQKSRVTKTVIAATRDASADVRKSALAALATADTPTTDTILKQLSESNNPVIRSDVAKILKAKQENV
jgi:hypothetical protein